MVRRKCSFWNDGDTEALCCLVQGQWGVTAEQEAEEKKRIQEFQDTIPKMRSQLRILTHFYQVPAWAIFYSSFFLCSLPHLHVFPPEHRPAVPGVADDQYR